MIRVIARAASLRIVARAAWLRIVARAASPYNLLGALVGVGLGALALAAASPVAAQPTPPRPPASGGNQPGRAPVVAPRPGAPARPAVRPPPRRPPARPPARPTRPVAHPPAPVIVPTPPAAAAPEPEKPAEPGKGSNTGQPLPRFATLRSDEVNLRSGPGTRYPIEWVYKRRDLPVQIEREFEVWRLVRDQEGVKGWVHQAVLAPRRTAVVVNGEHALRRDPNDDSAPVARLKPGVIVRLRSCEAAADWCQGQVQDYRGWIRRGDIWGTFPGEAIQ